MCYFLVPVRVPARVLLSLGVGRTLTELAGKGRLISPSKVASSSFVLVAAFCVAGCSTLVSVAGSAECCVVYDALMVVSKELMIAMILGI